MGAGGIGVRATVNLRPVTQWKRSPPMSGWHLCHSHEYVVPPSIGHTGNARHGPAFYMATLSMVQHNPLIKNFCTRLPTAGKPEKAPVEKDQSFNPDYARVEKLLNRPLPYLHSF